MNLLFQGGEAQPGGGVVPGAEGQAGVQIQRNPLPGIRILPLGHHQQPISDLNGLVILLPVVLPVLVRQVVQGHHEAAPVLALSAQVLQGQADLPQLGEACLVRLEVEGHPGQSLHAAGEVLVHVVPILAVVLQKLPELRLVVNHHAVHIQGGQHGLHRLQAGVVGINVYFQPIQAICPFREIMVRIFWGGWAAKGRGPRGRTGPVKAKDTGACAPAQAIFRERRNYRAVPRKNSAMVPGPEWLPITGPT